MIERDDEKEGSTKMSSKCNERIYQHGSTYGIYDMPTEEAEELCKNLTAQNKNQTYDWFYAAGRVVVKYIDNDFKTREDLEQELQALKDKYRWRDVKEELPEDGVEVLACYQTVDEYLNDVGYSYGIDFYDYELESWGDCWAPIKWMLLPEKEV
jgi:hypothetical protein